MAWQKAVLAAHTCGRFMLRNVGFTRSLRIALPFQAEKNLTDASESEVSGFTKQHKVLTKGDTISVNKLVSIGDVDDFCELTGDYNPIHTKSRIVHGALLNGLVSSVIGTSLPGPGTLVISQNLFFPASCVAPECITVTVAITSARKLIDCEFYCSTTKGIIVLKGNAKLMMKK